MYIKIDSKVTNRFEIEQLIKGYKSGNSRFCCLPAALVAEVLNWNGCPRSPPRTSAITDCRSSRDLPVRIFTLNLGLHFQLAVFDQFNDLLHRANALLQLRFNKPFYRCARYLPVRRGRCLQCRA